VKIAGRAVLQACCDRHPDLRGWAEAWLAEVKRASWHTPHDLKAQYGSASLLSGTRVVFNARGNRYRVLVQVNYQAQLVLIKNAGTHEEYDAWDL
jgi:mRNA interferase HigB